jgi:hypothetical protein
MPQLNDLSRSLVVLEQDATLIAVIEMSLSSWLVAGIVPGVERQPLKKLAVDESALLKLLNRWREEAEKAGRKIEHIAVAFEAGRDGFWLARWLRARGIEAHARAGLAWKLRDQCAVGTLGEFVEKSFHCRNVGEAMQALAVHAKFTGRLRPAQHQHCEECRCLLRHAHHAFDVMRISRNAFAAPLDGQNHAFQAVDRRPDVRLGCVEDRIAARFLIAARNERIQRERIAVGNGALFLDEDTEHARFKKGQSSGHGNW